MTPSDPEMAADLVRRLADEAGFALTGIAPAAPTEHRDYVERWLSEGRHGEMEYLADHLEKRLDPRRLVPGARSVICVADRYGAGTFEPADDRPRGRLARYGRGDDYHKVLKKRLFTIADTLRERWPDETFQCATDTAPVLEHEHAARAGIGFTGKHTLTIHPRMGSWLLLGEIVTTLELETEAARRGADPDEPLTSFGASFNGCGTCTRCIDACPTDCIDPWALDAQRCIGYLTIEHRGPIDPEMFEPMGDWIGGCDICQDVCPYNRETSDTPPSHPRYAPDPERAAGLPLAEVIHWTHEDRIDALRGSALTRIKLEPMRRNALIAAGNVLARTEEPELLDAVRRAAADEEPELVRETARCVLKRLGQ